MDDKTLEKDLEKRGMIWLIIGLLLVLLRILFKLYDYVHGYFGIETNPYPSFELLELLKPDVWSSIIQITIKKLINWKAWILLTVSLFLLWRIVYALAIDKIVSALRKMWVLILLNFANFIYLTFRVDNHEGQILDFSSVYTFVYSLKEFISSEFLALSVTVLTMVRIYYEMVQLHQQPKVVNNETTDKKQNKKPMFKGNSSITFKTTKFREEVFDNLEEELSMIGKVDIGENGTVNIDSTNYNGIFTKSSFNGTIRQKEDKYFVSIDFGSTLSIFGWIVLVIGFFVYGLGLLVLIAPGLTKGEIKGKVDKVLENIRFQYK